MFCARRARDRENERERKLKAGYNVCCNVVSFVRLGVCLGLVFTCTVIIPRLVKLHTTARIFTRIVEVEAYTTSINRQGGLRAYRA